MVKRQFLCRTVDVSAMVGPPGTTDRLPEEGAAAQATGDSRSQRPQSNPRRQAIPTYNVEDRQVTQYHMLAPEGSTALNTKPFKK